MSKRQPLNGWLRDRDLLAAWAFRIVATALLSLVFWNLQNYTRQIDELSKEVPVLSNTVAALTNQLHTEQDQINKIWDRLFEAFAQGPKKK